MFEVCLKEYRKTVPFIQMFDTLLSIESHHLSVTKDSLLKDLGINPSSFRRCRNEEQNVGNLIVEKLSKYFNLKLIDEDYLVKLSNLVTQIYYDVNFKIFDMYDEYEKEINELSLEKSIMFPVITMLKLFLASFTDKNVDDVIRENREEFI